MRRRIAGAATVLTLALTAGIAGAEPDTSDPIEQPTPEVVVPLPEAAAPLELAGLDRADEIRVSQRSYRAFTLTSPKTKRMRGVLPSLYRGKYFEPTLEERRRCIVERESSGHYDVVSPGGGYFGAYQMSPELGVGATWMMLDEHKKLLGTETAKQVLAELREQPVHTWPRYWQDAAFSTVHNWEGKGSGAAHWAGGRWSC